jgi:hypothetical protein
MYRVRSSRHSGLDPESPASFGWILNDRRKYPWVQVQDDGQSVMPGVIWHQDDIQELLIHSWTELK